MVETAKRSGLIVEIKEVEVLKEYLREARRISYPEPFSGIEGRGISA